MHIIFSDIRLPCLFHSYTAVPYLSIIVITVKNGCQLMSGFGIERFA